MGSCKKKIAKNYWEFLGTITQNGLVKPEKEIIKESLKNISVKEYACSHFIQTSNDNILETLQNYFPDWWKEIFISSFLRLMYSCPLKNFEFLYKQSFISEEIKGARMSKNSLTQMLNSVGGRREAIASLFKNYLWVANLY